MSLKFQTALIICSITLLGMVMQLMLWKSENTTILQALFSHWYLWIAYWLVGVFGAEHILNYFRRRRK